MCGGKARRRAAGRRERAGGWRTLEDWVLVIEDPTVGCTCRRLLIVSVDEGVVYMLQ